MRKGKVGGTGWGCGGGEGGGGGGGGGVGGEVVRSNQTLLLNPVVLPTPNLTTLNE